MRTQSEISTGHWFCFLTKSIYSIHRVIARQRLLNKPQLISPHPRKVVLLYIGLWRKIRFWKSMIGIGIEIDAVHVALVHEKHV